jgi:muramoyltetrapeptide carboxypeptidase
MINRLQPGDCIALVAPSSPFELEKFYQARDLLENEGYRLAPGRSSCRKHGYLAGTEAERAEDLIGAVSNPEVAAIICIRGGYGSSRLLPWLPFPILQRTPKIFLGYSDATFLHAAFWTKTRWSTFHGPNLLDLVDFPGSVNHVVGALSGVHDFAWEVEENQILRQGLASGTLLGGNLTCFCHLLGTPYFPDLKGALLLLEDRGEALYRLDRLFTQLKLAGVLSQLGGLIFGHFRECGEPRKVKEMFLDQVRDYSFPVIADLPFGHGSQNQVIPLGCLFRLNTFERTLEVINGPFLPGDREGKQVRAIRRKITCR